MSSGTVVQRVWTCLAVDIQVVVANGGHAVVSSGDRIVGVQIKRNRREIGIGDDHLCVKEIRRGAATADGSRGPPGEEDLHSVSEDFTGCTGRIAVSGLFDPGTFGAVRSPCGPRQPFNPMLSIAGRLDQIGSFGDGAILGAAGEGVALGRRLKIGTRSRCWRDGGTRRW